MGGDVRQLWFSIRTNQHFFKARNIKKLIGPTFSKRFIVTFTLKSYWILMHTEKIHNGIFLLRQYYILLLIFCLNNLQSSLWQRKRLPFCNIQELLMDIEWKKKRHWFTIKDTDQMVRNFLKLLFFEVDNYSLECLLTLKIRCKRKMHNSFSRRMHITTF